MTTILYDGPSDSVGWLVARLREIAAHASSHEGAVRPRSTRTNNDPAGKVIARMSHTGRTTWLNTMAYVRWDGSRMVRFVYRRSSSAALIIDAPLPRTRLSRLAADLPTIILEAASTLGSARVVKAHAKDEGMESVVRAMPSIAMAIHGADIGTWIASSTPWNPPRMIVRDACGRMLRIGLSDRGIERIAALGHVLRLEVDNGAYGLEPETWSSGPIAYDVVEAMRACSKEEDALCVSV